MNIKRAKEPETMSNGRFGIHGGQFIPETLMSAVTELEAAYEHYKNDPQFVAELRYLLEEYTGRPSRLSGIQKRPGGKRRRPDGCLSSERGHAVRGLYGQGDGQCPEDGMQQCVHEENRCSANGGSMWSSSGSSCYLLPGI